MFIEETMLYGDHHGTNKRRTAVIEEKHSKDIFSFTDHASPLYRLETMNKFVTH